MDIATPATGTFMPLVLLQKIAMKIINNEGNYQSLIVGLIISIIVIYIIALIFSKKSSCIIIYGWKDFAILVCPLVTITFIILFNVFYGRENEKTIEANNILANIIFILPIIATFAISVVSNIRHSKMPCAIFFTTISIVTKIVVMIFMAIFIILCIVILAGYQEKEGRKKDARFKTGYRPGKSNILFIAIALTILGGLATFFVKSLVKTSDDISSFTYTEEVDEEEENGRNEEK